MEYSLTFCWGDAQGSAFSYLSCSGRSASVNMLQTSSSGHSTDFITSMAENIYPTCKTLWVPTQVSCVHSLWHCPDRPNQSLVSHITIEKPAHDHLCTVNPLESLRDVYPCAKVFSFAWSHTIRLRLRRFAIYFLIGKIDFPLACSDSNHIDSFKVLGNLYYLVLIILMSEIAFPPDSMNRSLQSWLYGYYSMHFH